MNGLVGADHIDGQKVDDALVDRMLKEFERIRDYYASPINYARPSYDDIKYIYLIKEMMGDSCKNYVEIGVLYGFSMSLMMRSVFSTNFYGVDLFGVPSRFDGLELDQFSYYREDVVGFVSSINRPVKYDFLNTNARIKENNVYGYNYRLFEGNSRSDEMVLSVKKEVPGGIDLLFIDGDHSYLGVEKDFLLYSTMVNVGGVVLFDDQDYPDVDCFIQKVGKNKSYHSISVENMGKIKRLFLKVD